MKKLLTVMCVVASLGLTLCLTGCGPSTPEEVAVACYKELANGNFEEAAKYAAREDAEFINKRTKEAAADTERFGKMKDQMKGAKIEVIGKAEITGNAATVKIKLTIPNGKEVEQVVSLVKEDGKWKVTFMFVASAIRRAVSKANVAAASIKARSLYTEIIVASVDRQAKGLPDLWPRTKANADSSKDNPDIADMAFNNSTEYFKALFDMNSYGDAKKWAPYVDKDALKHLKISNDDGFCDFIVAANVEDDFDDYIPVLISANVDPASLKTSYNGKDDALIPFGSKVGRTKHKWCDQFVIVVTKGGGALTFTPDTFKYSALYQKHPFEAPGLKYLDVE